VLEPATRADHYHPAMSAQPALPLSHAAPQTDRLRLERRARRLAWWGNAWHLVEFAIAMAAGVAAGSVALVAFGVDSLIEILAGGVVVWLFSGGRGASAWAERTAQRAIALSFFLLAAYVVVESLRTLTGDHPATSWVGIGLAAVTAPTMPLLARAKRNVGRQLGSRATQSEGQQNMVCAYLSVALLVGLAANALLGWWWADPMAGLVIGAVAVREGREAWAGDARDCC
jgi:divalent metal cation (Fe/Co/Zn/Cd) transporter